MGLYSSFPVNRSQSSLFCFIKLSFSATSLLLLTSLNMSTFLSKRPYLNSELSYAVADAKFSLLVIYQLCILAVCRSSFVLLCLRGEPAHPRAPKTQYATSSFLASSHISLSNSRKCPSAASPFYHRSVYWNLVIHPHYLRSLHVRCC